MLDCSISKSGWTHVAFGDVVRLSKTRVADPEAAGIERVVGLEHIDPGDLRIRRWGDVADSTTFTTLFKPGQVLFGKRRAYQRKLAVADFEGVCSGDIYVLEPSNEQLMPELLPFLCQTEAFFDHAVGTSAGSLSPRTNWDSIASYQFLLPPLQEQNRIRKILDVSQKNLNAHLSLTQSAQTVLEAFAKKTLRSNSNKLTKVAEIAKFTSGKQLSVSGLPQKPSPVADIPVYGGNGVSGYTHVCLEDCKSPTIVIGRVGQYCGVTLLTTGPAWITDNALYPKRIEPSIDLRYLFICLKALDLNRGKLGEYLPLITQAVVHDAAIPLIPRDQQDDCVETFMAIEQGLSRALLRCDQSKSLNDKIRETLLGATTQ